MRRHPGTSFDQLIGAKQETGRDFQPNRLRRIEIYDQLKFRGLLDWNVGGLCSAQYLHDHLSSLAVHFRKSRTISDQSTFLGVLSPLENAGQSQLREALNECATIDREEWARQKIDCLSARLFEVLDRRQYFVARCNA